MRHSTALELMDQPELVTREEMAGCLHGLRRVNHWLGGRRVLLRALAPFLSAQRNSPLHICDIGTGAGDLPIIVAEFARRNGIQLRITAVELNPDLCDSARQACARFPEISVVCADAREVLNEGFDLVTASLFLHHFQSPQVVEWITRMDNAAKLGWIINDLERHPLAYAGIRIAGPFLSRNRVFLHDAPLSVRRSYTPAEWLLHARSAGAHGAALRRHWPWRITLVNSRAQSAKPSM
ncbi:methyltransferase domain-containing protein [Candidatus Sumerlaeota bacterium]|nr:methyltransferase domain-containing protein [Candidatus Sumerlaeota bacterium]